jgi:hypothetical protein
VEGEGARVERGKLAFNESAHVPAGGLSSTAKVQDGGDLFEAEAGGPGMLDEAQERTTPGTLTGTGLKGAGSFIKA